MLEDPIQLAFRTEINLDDAALVAADDADFRAQGETQPIFRRPGVHRVWVQFQRKGVVNTIAFNVPVAAISARSWRSASWTASGRARWRRSR